MVNYCSVLDCKSNSRDNGRLNFFMIPREPMRQIVWLPLIKREEWILQDPEVVAKKRICSLHFSPHQISGSRLKKDAEPDLLKDSAGFEGASTSKMESSTILEPSNTLSISPSTSSEASTPRSLFYAITFHKSEALICAPTIEIKQESTDHDLWDESASLKVKNEAIENTEMDSESHVLNIKQEEVDIKDELLGSCRASENLILFASPN